MKNKPHVSVIIPVYNQADFVGQAIESVLDQTYQHFEIIVVSDASPDHSAEIVTGYQAQDSRVKLIVHEQNQRLPATRNTGMRAAAGELFAFLDADDYFHPDKLAEHVDFLAKRPEIGVSYNGRFELTHSDTTIRGIWRPPKSVNLLDLILGFPFSPSDTVVRRQWAFEVGLFNPAMGSAEDTDFPCRLALAGCQFAGIDRALNYRRYHSGRGRKNLPGRLNDVKRALAAVFDDPRCPADLLQGRDMAIKHHLMVIVSLALIQEETALAHKYLRELVELDPTVVEGQPSELLTFLLDESIADEKEDHEEILRRIFAQLPADFRDLQADADWAIARGHLLKGTWAVIWQRPEVGHYHFNQVARFHGAVVDEKYIQRLTQDLLNFENEFGLEATQDVLQTLAPFLTKIGRQQLSNELKGSFLINLAFDHYRASDHALVPAKVLQAVRYDPKLLMNRGVLSILIHSLLEAFTPPH